MKIPIRNLYYLFCYAWTRANEGLVASVDFDDCPDLPNLLAKIFVIQVNRLIRRGLERGYVGVEEESRSPRGRFLIDRVIKEQTLLRGAVVCQLDELRRDVVHNQVLKATAILLLRHERISPSLVPELRYIVQKLRDVSDVRLSSKIFRGIQLFRNNSQYVLLMRLAEFVYNNTIPSSEGNAARFYDVLNDETRMSAVFEEFLKNFYFLEQSNYSVSSEELRWGAISLASDGVSLIPVMRTDLTLRSPNKVIVVDAKYYTEPFPKFFGVKKLRSSHLYQLFAYIKNIERRSPSIRVDGMLIYASTGEPLSQRYQIHENCVSVIAVDLTQPWRAIHDQLIGLVEMEDEGFSATERPCLPLSAFTAVGAVSLTS